MQDERDFDGINGMILADINVKGKPTKALAHFGRNGFGCTPDRMTDALLVAGKYDQKVNWATHVDTKTGRPRRVKQYSTAQNGPDANTEGVCPAAPGIADAAARLAAAPAAACDDPTAERVNRVMTCMRGHQARTTRC